MGLLQDTLRTEIRPQWIAGSVATVVLAYMAYSYDATQQQRVQSMFRGPEVTGGTIARIPIGTPIAVSGVVPASLPRGPHGLVIYGAERTDTAGSALRRIDPSRTKLPSFTLPTRDGSTVSILARREGRYEIVNPTHTFRDRGVVISGFAPGDTITVLGVSIVPGGFLDIGGSSAVTTRLVCGGDLAMASGILRRRGIAEELRALVPFGATGLWLGCLLLVWRREGSTSRAGKRTAYVGSKTVFMAASLVAFAGALFFLIGPPSLESIGGQASRAPIVTSQSLVEAASPLWVMAPGRISMREKVDRTGLLIYDGSGSAAGEGAALERRGHLPDFRLDTPDGAVQIRGSRFRIINPPHLSGPFRGFKPGDAVTVLGEQIGTGTTEITNSAVVSGGPENLTRALAGDNQRDWSRVWGVGLIGLSLGLLLIPVGRRLKRAREWQDGCGSQLSGAAPA